MLHQLEFEIMRIRSEVTRKDLNGTLFHHLDANVQKKCVQPNEFVVHDVELDLQH